MPKFKCKVKVKIWEESEIEETIEVDAPDEVTAEDDALTIANEMKSNSQPWLDMPRVISEYFEFEVENVEELNGAQKYE